MVAQADMVHGADDGKHLPVPAGNPVADTPAPRGTSIEPRHLGGNAAFIHIDQVFGRDRTEGLEVSCAPLEISSVSRSVACSDLFKPQTELAQDAPQVHGADSHALFESLLLQLDKHDVRLRLDQLPDQLVVHPAGRAAAAPACSARSDAGHRPSLLAVGNADSFALRNDKQMRYEMTDRICWKPVKGFVSVWSLDALQRVMDSIVERGLCAFRTTFFQASAFIQPVECCLKAMRI